VPQQPADNARTRREFFWHRLRWRAARRYIPKGTDLDLVDVGAGEGLIGDYLKQERPQVRYRFVEPIDSFAETLNQRYGAAANLNDCDNYGGAEVITLLDVLEHQEHDDEFLLELAGKMSPGSRLILTVPAMPILWSAFDEGIGHFKRYTKTTLGQAAAGLPLRRIETNYLFPEMVPAAFVRRKQRPPGATVTTEADEAMVAALADIPELSGGTNQALYVTGVATQAIRRFVPAGSSLFAVYERV
jgi:hypothetical protein